MHAHHGARKGDDVNRAAEMAFGPAVPSLFVWGSPVSTTKGRLAGPGTTRTEKGLGGDEDDDDAMWRWREACLLEVGCGISIPAQIRPVTFGLAVPLFLCGIVGLRGNMGANKTVLLHGSDGRRCDWGMPRLRAKLSMRGRGPV